MRRYPKGPGENDKKRVFIWTAAMAVVLIALVLIVGNWVGGPPEMRDADGEPSTYSINGAFTGRDTRQVGADMARDALTQEVDEVILIGTSTRDGAQEAHEVLADPKSKVGQEVKAGGSIVRVLTENAFVLDRSGLTGREEILVLNQDTAAAVDMRQGDHAVVAGTVQSLDDETIDGLESEIQEEILAAYRGQEVIVVSRRASSESGAY